MPKKHTSANPKVMASALATARGAFSRLKALSWSWATTLLWYCMAMIVVGGVLGVVDVSAIRSQIDGLFVSSSIAYIELLASGAAGDQTGAAYQVVLFLLLVVTCIWMFRQKQAAQPATTKAALYQGVYPLVPFMLSLFLLCVQLVPLALAAGLYQVVISAGIAASVFEVILWSVALLGVAIATLYFIIPTIFSVYIVTLPKTGPIQAYRSAKTLVAGRRWLLARRLTLLPILLLAGSISTLMPFIIVLPILAQLMYVVVAAVCVMYSVSYGFELYTQLLAVRDKKVRS